MNIKRIILTGTAAALLGLFVLGCQTNDRPATKPVTPTKYALPVAMPKQVAMPRETRQGFEPGPIHNISTAYDNAIPNGHLHKEACVAMQDAIIPQGVIGSRPPGVPMPATFLMSLYTNGCGRYSQE